MSEIKLKFKSDVKKILQAIEDGVEEILKNPEVKDEDVPNNPYQAIAMMVDTMYFVTKTKGSNKQLEDLLNVLEDELNRLEKDFGLENLESNEAVTESPKAGSVRVLKTDKGDLN